jgi:hypothetical protein
MIDMHLLAFTDFPPQQEHNFDNIEVVLKKLNEVLWLWNNHVKKHWYRTVYDKANIGIETNFTASVLFNLVMNCLKNATDIVSLRNCIMENISNYFNNEETSNIFTDYLLHKFLLYEDLFVQMIFCTKKVNNKSSIISINEYIDVKIKEYDIYSPVPNPCFTLKFFHEIVFDVIGKLEKWNGINVPGSNIALVSEGEDNFYSLPHNETIRSNIIPIGTIKNHLDENKLQTITQYQDLCNGRPEQWLLCNGVLPYQKEHNVSTINNLLDNLRNSNNARLKEQKIPAASTVYNTSFTRIFSSTWFDSYIINSMFLYYNEVSHRKGLKNYFIADWAMHNIINSEYKNQTLQQFKDIFDADTLIMATNENQLHWMLMVVDVQFFTVTCYDSLGCGNKTIGNKLLKYMEKEAIERKMPEKTVQGWQKNGKYVLGKMGKQNNSYDCGPFTVMAAEFILFNIPLTELHQSDMRMYRYLIAWHILNGKIMYE